MNIRRFFSFILISLCFLGISCSFELNKYGSIGIILPTNSNRGVEDESQGALPKGTDFPETYTIKLTPNKGEIINKTGNAGDRIFIDNLNSGDYEIIVEGKTDTQFFHGKTNTIIKAGETVHALITLTVTNIEQEKPVIPVEPDVPVNPVDPDKPVNPTDGSITLAQAKEKIATHNSGLLELNINDVTDTNISELITAVYNAKLNATISLDLSSCSSLTVSGDFSGCDKLTKIVYPDSVTAIGEATFSNCSELREIVFGNNLTRIKTQAFMNCSGLSSINLSNVTTIGNKAFQGCKGLTSINFPDSVSEIGAMAFMDSGLTSATGLMGLWNINGAIQDLTIMTATQVAILLKDTSITTPWTKQQ